MGELAARLRALIRRASGKTEPLLADRRGETRSRCHRVLYRDKPVELSSREFAVLHALMLNVGKVLSRVQLEENSMHGEMKLKAMRWKCTSIICAASFT